MATRNREADSIGRAHVSANESPEGLAITGLGPPDQILVRCTLLFTHETPLPPAVLSTFAAPATPQTHHPLDLLSEGPISLWPGGRVNGPGVVLLKISPVQVRPHRAQRG